MSKITVILYVLFLCAIVFNASQVLSQDISQLTMQNIEALSNTESNTFHCFGLGSVDCPNSRIKVKSMIN